VEIPDCLPFPSPDAPEVPPIAAHIFATIAGGARCVRLAGGDAPDPAALHRTRLQLAVVAELLETGVHAPSVPATDGLIASSWSIRERGTAIFVTNPTERDVVGSVFPAVPSLAVAAGQTKLLLMDHAIGPAGRYLSAYAGLVKSTVPVLQAAIRPDPHAGACVVVCGTPGERSEIVLFHSGRGVSVPVEFADHPRVAVADSCLVAAWPEALAGTLRLEADGAQSAGGWRIEADGTLARWWTAVATAPGGGSARLDPAPLHLRVDGTPVDPNDFELRPGPMRLEAAWPGPKPPADALLLPDGACWALGIEVWSAAHEEPGST